MSGHLLILFLALLLDRIVGDPDWLWRRFPHPVVLFGKAISLADTHMNRASDSPQRRKHKGLIALCLLLFASLAAGVAVEELLSLLGWPGILIEAIIASVLLAEKSLADHVLAVASGLRRDGLKGGRYAVSMIVGRDPETLDEPGVCRAAIESLAENFSDGVVAPAFWFLILGLPGLFAYKMLNTADSMIGHKNTRYLEFGWASARTDDFANWIPARFSVLLIAIAALFRSGQATARRALDVALRDAALHRSPNSGWPESAMAGALDIQLAGPRVYAGVMVSEPMINGAGRRIIAAGDVEKAVSLFHTSADAMSAMVLLAAFLALAG